MKLTGNGLFIKLSILLTLRTSWELIIFNVFSISIVAVNDGVLVIIVFWNNKILTNKILTKTLLPGLVE